MDRGKLNSKLLIFFRHLMYLYKLCVCLLAAELKKNYQDKDLVCGNQAFFNARVGIQSLPPFFLYFTLGLLLNIALNYGSGIGTFLKDSSSSLIYVLPICSSIIPHKHNSNNICAVFKVNYDKTDHLTTQILLSCCRKKLVSNRPPFLSRQALAEQLLNNFVNG